MLRNSVYIFFSKVELIKTFHTSFNKKKKIPYQKYLNPFQEFISKHIIGVIDFS